ncbi:hypothetical protein E2C01_049730 [Portunus trituberculatus]|uniref:Uncharacterized protein n=1 Tax=Portunus trituberculatus TaxID=210409 RepID=A0A5B7GDZ3_PORTR|nr:hypothetical protein [Portunus trituberculatus]
MGSDTAKGGRHDSLHPERIVLATPQRLTPHSLLLLLLLLLLYHHHYHHARFSLNRIQKCFCAAPPLHLRGSS